VYRERYFVRMCRTEKSLELLILVVRGVGDGGDRESYFVCENMSRRVRGYVIQYCLRNTAVYIVYLSLSLNRVYNIILLILAIKHPTRAKTSVPRPAAPAPPKSPPSLVTSIPRVSEIPIAPHPP